jgi:hypothetical protein
MYGVTACHEGGSRGCAGRLHIVAVENDAVICQGVDIRRRDLI